MGKLIVLEGTDGSGKSTQFGRLTDHLARDGRQFQKLVFPQYSEPSSALIRMYLGGEFGDKPSDVNAYAASAFYSVDRYASYKKVWGQWYENGKDSEFLGNLCHHRSRSGASAATHSGGDEHHLRTIVQQCANIVNIVFRLTFTHFGICAGTESLAQL